MNPRAVSCTRCQATLSSPVFFNTPMLVPCPACGTFMRVLLFPVFFRAAAAGVKAEEVLVPGQSACFYHPQKKAVEPCGKCGRFLCALCDLQLNGQHICPVCLERGQQKHTLESLENQRVRYDSLALLLAIVPLLIWPVTLLTAPAALWFCIHHWNSRTSLVRPSKTRFIIAISLALLEIIGWGIGLCFAFRR